LGMLVFFSYHHRGQKGKVDLVYFCVISLLYFFHSSFFFGEIGG